jgi:diketogulonate reductase-like aldo/keto reductase
MTPAQIALAWTLRFEDMFVVAKSSHIERVTDNRAAAEIELTGEELARLDVDFPPPAGPSPIEIL